MRIRFPISQLVVGIVCGAWRPLALAGLCVVVVPAADLRAQSIVGTISREGLVPYNVAVYEARNKVIIADNATGNLEFYDGTSLALLGSVPVGTEVSAMVVDEASGKLYAIARGGPGIAVVDANTGALIRRLPNVFASVTSSMVLDAGLRKVYAQTQILHQIDIPTDHITIAAAGTLINIALNPATHELFGSTIGGLVVVNGTTLATTMYGINGGYGLAVDPPSNKVYITYATTDTHGEPGALVFDRNQNTFVPLLYKNDALSIIYSPASRRFYTSSEIDQRVSLVDATTGAFFNLGFPSPAVAMAAREATRHVYYAHPNAIFMIDDATQMVGRAQG